MNTFLASITTMTAFASSSASAQAPSESAFAAAGWEVLAPLPDPVGFGGMFAGALNGRLLAGGGSKFEDKPVWLQGTKVYSDNIYTLTSPGGSWVILDDKLPEKMGHFASATTADRIYLVGGINASGSLPTGLKLSDNDGRVIIERLPELPKPIVYAVAAIAAGRLILTGGQRTPADKEACSETWSLELSVKDAVWRREADFPGAAIFVASAAADADYVYVFGGMSFDSSGKYLPSTQAHRYKVSSGEWERLPDMPEPRVGACSPCPMVMSGKFMLIGGYATIFPGAPREHPGFSEQTLIYDSLTGTWSEGPFLPKSAVINRDLPSDSFPGPMLAAPCAIWEGRAVVVSGESRASVRTPAVVSLKIKDLAK